MSISDNYAPDVSLGNGVTTVFTGSWKVLNEDYFRLSYEDVITGEQFPKVLGADFTLSFSDTGYVATIISGAPTASFKVIRFRQVTDDQEVPYRTSRAFNGLNFEFSLDKLTAITQDQGDDILRSLKFQVGSSAGNYIIENPQDGYALIWDAVNNKIVNSSVPFDDIVPSLDELVALAAALELTIEQFNAVYLGAKAADPTLDNSGNPLVVGALYFNTVSNALKSYNGTVWDFPIIADGSVSTAKMGGDVTSFGKALLTAASHAAQRILLGFSTALDALWTAVDIPAARVALGAGATGVALFISSTITDALSALGMGFNIYTPNLTFGNNQVGMVQTAQEGVYFKLGRFVLVLFRIALSAKGSSTGAVGVSVPFAGSSTGITVAQIPLCTVQITAGSSLPAGIACNITPGESRLRLTSQGTTTVTSMVETSITNTSTIYGACFYLTD